MSGAGCSGTPGSRLGNSIFMIAIDIERFTPMELFLRRVKRFIEFIKSCPLAPGFDEILIPGEPEIRTRKLREREGIYVDEATWEQIVKAAESVGVKL